MTRIAVVLPATNQVVADDFAALAPAGTQFAYSTFSVESPAPGTPGGFLQILGDTRKAIRDATSAAIANSVDAVIIATSAETFWGGVAGNAEFEEHLTALTELPISTAASACDAALDHLGAHTIALLTPYPATAERETRVFFDEAGYTVARVRDLGCRDTDAIAAIEPEATIGTIAELAAPDIEAVVQIGSNLRLAQHLEKAEAAAKAPVLAINAVLLWHALRNLGEDAKLTPRCRLFQHD